MRVLTKWLNKIVNAIGIFALLTGVANAQPITHLTLDRANDMARENYPIIKQKDLIKQTANLNIENLNKGYLPQFSFVLSGQASYQSDVTQLNIPIPNVKIEPLSKDQYKVLGDVSQLIYDGGAMKQQDEMQQLNAEVEQQKIKKWNCIN